MKTNFVALGLVVLLSGCRPATRTAEEVSIHYLWDYVADDYVRAKPTEGDEAVYVGADDKVRFFSQTKERIFPRSPAIIGREVQKCHPPASVHRVQRIVDDFREGRRDEAEFWIQMGPKFIHIRYFAIRDEQGKYQGTLEVSQDVTGIRALEGERRLLDEGE